MQNTKIKTENAKYENVFVVSRLGRRSSSAEVRRQSEI